MSVILATSIGTYHFVPKYKRIQNYPIGWFRLVTFFGVMISTKHCSGYIFPHIREKIDIPSDIDCRSRHLFFSCAAASSILSPAPRRRLRLRIKSWNWIFLIIPSSLPVLLSQVVACISLLGCETFNLRRWITTKPLHNLTYRTPCLRHRRRRRRGRRPHVNCVIFGDRLPPPPFIPDFVAALLSELELET